ncbi:MAG: hypothetical protein ACFFBD_02290 [Candidatus Hodarchaeota archaeon]
MSEYAQKCGTVGHMFILVEAQIAPSTEGRRSTQYMKHKLHPVRKEGGAPST